MANTTIKGWEYLNSTQTGAVSTDDGSWEVVDRDGNSTFYDSDGSWGYKKKDGEAAYYGEDGSWGQRESDGKIVYYGADGSWGYRNPDGTGTYYAAEDNEVVDIVSDENTNHANESWDELLARAREVISVRSQINEINETLERKKRARDRKLFLIKNWKSLLMLLASVACVVGIYICVDKISKLTVISYSAEDLVGENYEIVAKKLRNAGFSNIMFEATYDLGLDESECENEVYQVIVWGRNSFSSSARFPYDSRIQVKYHALKMIPTPMSSKEMRGIDYRIVEREFFEAGYENVESIPANDLIFGWLASSESVKSVSIDGISAFDKGEEFRIDSKVVITYHDFKNE